MAGDSEGSQVQLYVYDLSMGLAAQLSPMFLGKQINGIWHTGVVVYGREYFYGGMGIEYCPPGGTIMGPPHQTVDLGRTQVPFDVFQHYLLDLSANFTPQSYDLFNHNCNTFSNEVAQFLTGEPIPAHITNLPAEVLETPFGAQIKPILDRFQGIGGPSGTVVAPGIENRGGSITAGSVSSAPSGTHPTSSGSDDKSSAESGGFPDSAVQQITSSGFTRSEAVEELSKCNGNVELAKVNLLAKAIKF